MEGSDFDNDDVTPLDDLEDELADEEVVDQLEPTNNDVLRCFIITYESFPQLWNPSHPDYMNKSKRNSAIDELQKIYSRLKPKATRADVRRKINTLRSNYRKELRKIVNSKRTANGTDDLYKPTSWVFYALTFLSSCMQPQFEQPTKEESIDSFSSETDFIPGKDNGIESATASIPVVSKPSTTPVLHPMKKRRVTGLLTKQIELLPLLNKRSECPNEADDTIPTVAKVWGEKLVQLDPKQRLFAEKAINDILFEASLGNLTRNSVKINEERSS